jgi:hypothetical protein
MKKFTYKLMKDKIELISTTSDRGTKTWYKTFKVICVKDFNTIGISKIGGLYTVDKIRDDLDGVKTKYYHIKEIDYWVLDTDFITVEQHRDNQLNEILNERN